MVKRTNDSRYGNKIKMNKLGILQGRLTASNGRGIQFFPIENWQNEFKEAKEVGFNSIELLIKKENLKENPLMSSEGIKEIISLKKTHRIQTSSVHAFYSKDTGYPDLFTEIVKQSAKIGAKVILVSFFKDSMLVTEGDKNFARTQLQKSIKTSEKLGLKIAIEAEMFAPELKNFVESFESKNVGIYYDIGNMVSLNANVSGEIRLLSKLIFGVHIKDRMRNGGETAPIGTGDTDFKAVLQNLKKVGYNGTYIIQGARKVGVGDVTLNKKYFEYIKNILEKIN